MEPEPTARRVNRERLPHVLCLAAREREVGLRLVEHQVDEQALVLLQRADDVVLAAERDQDVLDHVVQAERVHGLVLGAHYLGIARGGNFQVHARADLPRIMPLPESTSAAHSAPSIVISSSMDCLIFAIEVFRSASP